jgi:hypothetical protein
MAKQKTMRWKMLKSRTKETATDRLRKVFALPNNESLPWVDDDSLKTFYDHLDRNLLLPAESRYCPKFNSSRSSLAPKVMLVGLDCEYRWDEESGIHCKIAMSEGEVVVPLVDLKVPRNHPNHRLVNDYTKWFSDDLMARTICDFEDEDNSVDYQPDGQEYRSRVPSIYSLPAILSLGILCSLFGGVLGSAVTAMSWAAWAAIVGSILCGTVAGIGFAFRAQKELPRISPRVSVTVGGLFGLFWGAVAGAFYGTAIVNIFGTIPGYIVGKFLRRFVPQKNRAIFMFLPDWPTIAVGCGVIVESLYWNRTSALYGLAYGAGIGICVALATWLCVVVLDLYSSNSDCLAS